MSFDWGTVVSVIAALVKPGEGRSACLFGLDAEALRSDVQIKRYCEDYTSEIRLTVEKA